MAIDWVEGMGTFVPPYPGKCDARFWGMVKNFGDRLGGVAAWILVIGRLADGLFFSVRSRNWGCGFGDRVGNGETIVLCSIERILA